MSVRLIITLRAKPGKGAEMAAAYKSRCEEIMQEPGCLQFEVFHSAVDPESLVLLEHWESQAALDAHAELNRTRPPIPGMEELRGEGPTAREDYEYNRTR